MKIIRRFKSFEKSISHAEWIKDSFNKESEIVKIYFDGDKENEDSYGWAIKVEGKFI